MKVILVGLLAWLMVTPATSLLASTSAPLEVGSPSQFSYVGGPYCQNSPNLFPTNVANPGQGMFSEATGNVTFASAVTGEINLSASHAGTWQIKRVVGSDSSFRAITILQADDASFGYPVDTACIGSANSVLPVLLGTSGGTFSSGSSGLVLNATTGAVNLNTTPAGTYAITYHTPGHCPDSSQVTLVIQAPPSAYFSYTQAAYCKNGLIHPDTIATPSAGTFQATPAGLILNPQNGMILLDSSLAGIYTLEYSIGGTCPAQWQQTLEVVEPYTGFLFGYVPDTVCHGDTLAMPLVFGPTHLTYSSTTGLTIDSQTGIIYPASSLPGTYVITAHALTPCNETTSQTLHILDSAIVQLTSSGDTLYAPGPGQHHQWHLNGSPITGAHASFYYTGGAPGVYSVHYLRQGDPCGTIGVMDITATPPQGTWMLASHLYPNPLTVGQELHCRLTLAQPSTATWELLDALGNQVRKGAMRATAAMLEGSLGMDGLQGGIYMLRIVTPRGSLAHKVVLMR